MFIWLVMIVYVFLSYQFLTRSKDELVMEPTPIIKEEPEVVVETPPEAVEKTKPKRVKKKVAPKVDSSEFEMSHYGRDEEKVIWSDEQSTVEMNQADSATFVPFGLDHAEDKNSIYFRGKVMVDVDKESFTRVNQYYGSDKDQVYAGGAPMMGVDRTTIVALDDYYARDRYQVYFLDTPGEIANSAQFEALGGGYGRDNLNVYQYGVIIEDCLPAGFDAKIGMNSCVTE